MIKTVEEKKCPVFCRSKIYSNPPCNAKIFRKEPVIPSEQKMGPIYGPTNVKEARTTDKKVPYYLYECEHGHILNRPEKWANVPTVPPGTIKSNCGTIIKPQVWYDELPEEKKEKACK